MRYQSGLFMDSIKKSFSHGTTRLKLFVMTALLTFISYIQSAQASSGGRITGSHSEKSAVPSNRGQSRENREYSRQQYSSASSYRVARVNRRTVASIEHQRGGGYSSSGVHLNVAQSYGFILTLAGLALFEPISQLLKKMSKRSSFYKFQFVFLLNSDELKDILDRISNISTKYSKDINGNLASLVEDFCVVTMRKKDALVAANIEHKRFRNADETYDAIASDMLLEASMAERAKVDRQTTDIDGNSHTSSMRSEASSKKSNNADSSRYPTYFILTILLACKGDVLRLKSRNEKLPPTDRNNVPITMELVDNILLSLPTFLKSLSRTKGSAFKADITWTPDQVDINDRLSELDFKALWPTALIL
jgi:uncharacterized membrane protein